MIDPQWREVARQKWEHREEQEHKQCCKRGELKTFCYVAQRQQCQQQPQQRDQRHGPQLGEVTWQHRIEQQDQPGQRQVDQARPMHAGAIGQAHAMLGHVKPALTSQ